MKKLVCIYCREAEFYPGQGSEEHAVLSALGGRKASRNMCCEKCNNALGRTIDQEFAVQWRVIGALIGVRHGRDGREKGVSRVAKINGEDVDLLPNGQLTFLDADVKFLPSQDGSGEQFSFRAQNADHARKLALQIAAKYGKTEVDLRGMEGVAVSTYGAKTQSGLSLGGEEQFRSAAKMLLTYLGTMISPQRLRSPAFREVIEYVRSGEGGGSGGNFAHFDDVTVLPHVAPLGRLSHRAWIFASRKKRMVLGVLEVFGAVRISAVLSRSWTGPTFGRMYEIDPRTSKWKEERLAVSSSIFKALTRRALKVETIRQWLNRVLSGTMEAQQERSIGALVKEAFAGFSDDAPLSLRDLEERIPHLADEMAYFAMKIGRTRPMPVFDPKSD